jgi:16S rRNA (cytosine1402-N4)-methyltransferase
MKPRGHRSTPSGEHLPVLLNEVLDVLSPRPGDVVVDGTIGWAGHAVELLKRIGPTGLLIGIDFDAENLLRAEERLREVGHPFRLRQGNFAGLPGVLAAAGVEGIDALLADLGMSSMQVDDVGRGFSYVRDGPLDMRMDRSRGRTAAQILSDISCAELAQALLQFGDEPQHEVIAAAVVAARRQAPIQRTGELVDVIRRATQTHDWQLHPARDKWNLHPAARTFQALRILVNRELGNLQELLRVLPACLKPGGRAAVISFHSGEDRLVKAAFRAGGREGHYAHTAEEPVRAGLPERSANPRSRSAKLRWVRRGEG